MKSNPRTASDDGQLPLRLVRTPQAIDPDIVVAQPTLLGAIKLCISLAGLESDKQVYSHLDIDPSHWTRITRGEAHFPVDKLTALMDYCQNEVPLIWLTHARGYEPRSLRKRESVLERELREEREKNARLEHEREIERRTYRDMLGVRA